MTREIDTKARALSARLSAHIGALAAHIRDVEHLLSHDLQGRGAPGPDFLTGLQSLDYVHQTLADAATVLDHAHVDLAATFDPHADLRLEVSRSLIAGTGAARPPGGEPELF